MTTEDEMAGQCLQSNQHEFDTTPGGSGGQEGLACSGPWGHEESDTTKQHELENVIDLVVAGFTFIYVYMIRLHAVKCQCLKYSSGWFAYVGNIKIFQQLCTLATMLSLLYLTTYMQVTQGLSLIHI